MGANDVPPVNHNKSVNQQNKPAEVRHMNPESKEKLDKLIDQIKKTGVKDGKETVMANQGQISRLLLPTGWSRGASTHSLPPTANFEEFHSDKSPDAKICTFYRGHRISPSAGKTFKDLIKAPVHDLSTDEFLALGEVLRDKAKAEDFDVTQKKTINLNGKNVLLIEGKFKAIKQKTYALFIDAEGSGEVVQELFYQAPEIAYDVNLPSAEAAFKGIVWK